MHWTVFQSFPYLSLLWFVTRVGVEGVMGGGFVGTGGLCCGTSAFFRLSGLASRFRFVFPLFSRAYCVRSIYSFRSGSMTSGALAKL